RRPAAGQERVAQDPQQVAEVVLAPDDARLAEHVRERLLHEVLRVFARAAQRPRGPVEAIDVIAEPGRVQLSFGQRKSSRGRGPWPTYLAVGRMSRPSRFCSRMWADQPAVRAHVNIDVNSSGGTSAKSSTTADQNSTLVASTRSGRRAL